jgi:hypothetical protein
MVCLRNICINTLHKGDSNNNNNNNKLLLLLLLLLLNHPAFRSYNATLKAQTTPSKNPQKTKTFAFIKQQHLTQGMTSRHHQQTADKSIADVRN